MATKKDKTILLVEDESIAAANAKAALEKTGYNVVFAASGESAVEVAQSSQTIDLILMDINLGAGIDGIETARRILAAEKIPVVFFSSHNEPEIFEKTEQVSSYGFIPKNSGDFALITSIKLAFRLYESELKLKDEHKALQAEKELLKVTLKSIGEGVIATDIAGNITVMNAPAQMLTGYSTSDAAGKPLSNIYVTINASSRQKRGNPVEGQLSDAICSGPDNDIILIDRQKNEYIISEVSSPILSASGVVCGAVLVFHDVTEEVELERALRSSERNRKKAQIMVQLGSWHIKRSSDEFNFSEEARTILGLDTSSCQVTRFINEIPLPQYRKQIKTGLKNLTRSAKAYNSEFEIRRLSDGEIRTIHSLAEYDASSKMIIGTVQDITALKKNEKDLRLREDLLKRIMETSPVGIITFNNEAVLTYANSTAAAILGIPQANLIGRSYFARDAIPLDADGNPLPRERLIFNVIKKSMHPEYDIRYTFTRPDGKKILLSVNASPMKDDKGSFGGIVITLEDITENRLAKERINTLLREKEILLNETHHRVKNNMNIIYSLLSLQADEIKDKQSGNILKDAANRILGMSMLYDKLYRSGNIYNPSIKDFLPSLIDEIIAIFPVDFVIKKELIFDDITLPPKILSPLGIILNELITNSMKYAFVNASEGIIRISITGKNNRVCVIYEDNGVGIPRNITFDESTGFGMQLVGMLVRQIGGRITLRCKGGTKFTIIFTVKHYHAAA